jgi:hypothetical protein
MTTLVSLVFAGSSFSVVGASTYNQLIQNWIRDNTPQYLGSYYTLARNGNNSWSSLVRLSGALTADTQTLIIDSANDDNSTIDKAALEAIIRRVWTYNPNIRIIGVSAPSWNAQDTGNDALVSTPTNLTEVNNAKAIFDHYSTSYAAYLDACIAYVAGGGHLNELTTDTVHPSSAVGHPLMASLVEAFLPFSGAQLSGSLPAWLLADAEDFENDPIVRLGTDNDGTTGTWTTTGSRVESTETNATIVFSGTFRSFGGYRVDGGTNVVEADIDGGGYNTISFGHMGYDIGTRGAHTVTLRVPAGGNCEIDEFWAI